MGGKKAGGGRGKGPDFEWPLTRAHLQNMAQTFVSKQAIPVPLAEKIVEEAAAVCSKLPTVIDVTLSGKGTVSVIGDTHGKLVDVVDIFSQFGLPTKDRRYIFNGDYVDRGDQGCEVVLLLCGWLLADPSTLTMLRGNHECRAITSMYGFAEEARKKYGAGFYAKAVTFFASLPLAAVIGGKALVLHGGLFRDSPTSTKLAKLQALRDIPPAARCAIDSVPQDGIIADVLWSDPAPEDVHGVQANGVRGSGCHFDEAAACDWLDEEGLDLLIRSHEGPDLQRLPEGYSCRADGRVVTVFSARNYLGHHDNKGGVVTFGRDLNPRFASF